MHLFPHKILLFPKLYKLQNMINSKSTWNASLFSIWTSKVVNMYVTTKCIPKDNLHVMVPFDRHPHTNTMEGDGWRRTATGALQEHSLSELMFSACRFWVHCTTGCYTFRVWVRCTLPQRKLTLSSIINYKFYQSFNIFWGDNPQYATISSFTMFLDHTQRRTTVGRTPLTEWLARRRGLYLTTQSHPCFRCDSNPQSLLASDHTATP
jgi:hypothetical protein